ncbi:MAG: NAD(P)/FAD-dependent oxidoreductase [Bacillota bacterium]|jgi:uncharacterized FAD-dependent dehydrogenase
MIRINELKMPLDADSADLKRAAAGELRIEEKNIERLYLRKKAVDARKKDKVCFTCCVDVKLTLNEEKALKKCRSKKAAAAKIQEYTMPECKVLPEKRPVIVGMGPAGLLCGVILAEAGLRPLLLDRGEDAESRKRTVEKFWTDGSLNPLSNVQFGQGGAGTFSDGKLTTNTKDKRNFRVLQEFAAAGAPEEILYLAKPHIGTDLLIDVVKKLGEKIERLGGELCFNSRVVDIRLLEQSGAKRICGVVVENEGGGYEIETDDVVLAIGHSARDTFQILYQRGVPMQAKPFSLGARIEHLQADINRSQYGDFAGHPALGAADYKLSCHLPGGRSVYTFCMCPGGAVVNASSEVNTVVTNGMSRHARAAENANAAVLVGVSPEDFGSSHPLAGIEFQRRIEQAAFTAGGGNYSAVCQKAGDFLRDEATTEIGSVKPSFLPGVALGKIDSCLPDFVTAALREGLQIFAGRMKAFGNPDAVLTAPETRSSSPVRILRDENYQSFGGLYPCGEGAGYAGGIMSAAADGIRVAEAVIKRYNQ